jgi:hypothetical protein
MRRLQYAAVTYALVFSAAAAVGFAAKKAWLDWWLSGM